MSQVFTVFCTDKSRDTTWIESVEVAGWNANLAIAEGRRRCADAWEQEPEEIIVLGVAAGVVEIPLWDDDGLEDPLPSKGGVRTTQQAFHSMRGHMVDGCEIQMDNGDLLVLKAVHGGWVLTRNGTPQDAPTNSAHVIECQVFSYPEDIGP